MDKVFKNFGLYDFFGVFGAGSICIVYTVLIDCIFNYSGVAIFNYLKDLNADFSFLFIFIFSIFAYMVGFILDVVAKWIFDVVKQTHIRKKGDVECRFDHTCNECKKCERYKKCGCAQSKSNSHKEKDVRDKLLNKIFHPIKIEKYNYIQSTDHIDDGLLLNTAIIFIRSKDKASITDKYHGLFGLTRGLSIFFLLHGAFYIVFSLIAKHPIEMIVIALDMILSILLFFRAYRMYLTWAKNIFLLYDNLQKEDHTHKKLAENKDREMTEKVTRKVVMK